MVAEAEVVIPQGIPAVDVQFQCSNLQVQEVATVAAVSSPSLSTCCAQILAAESPAVDLACPQQDIGSPVDLLDSMIGSATVQFVPSIRSASFADVGPRWHMEDEHIRIDDLSAHLSSVNSFPKPSAFYGVFDGHGGPDASAFVRKNILKLFFEDFNFPQTSEADDTFLEEVKNYIQKAFLLADSALADDGGVSCTTRTTILTALILGSNSILGGLGPETPSRLPSPLIAEPEFHQTILTKDDELLIIGCDGIWDVMSSGHAVNLVCRGLLRHNDPERCARNLVWEALRLNTSDNLTVVIICFTSFEHRAFAPSSTEMEMLQFLAEALSRKV